MKSLFTLVFSIIFSSTIFAQELSPETRALREQVPETYETIKKFSQNKWEDDFSMVLYEINKQSEAYMEYVNFVNKLEDNSPSTNIVINALVKWGWEEEDKSKTDWTMVMYEIEKQISARNKY